MVLKLDAPAPFAADEDEELDCRVHTVHTNSNTPPVEELDGYDATQREVQTVDDPRFTRGLLNLREASRYLRIPRQTFHRWARGYERGGPLLHVLPPIERFPAVTFTSLAEAHVLSALVEAGVRAQKIRPALDRLQKEFGREYVLVAPELATDGIDVLWDFSRTSAGEGLIAGHSGQNVIRAIVTDYLSYIARAGDGYPEQLQLPNWQPSKVLVDVRRNFGQPYFASSGARVTDVAAMLKAGEDVDAVAEEYGVSEHDVRTAARILLGRAS